MINFTLLNSEVAESWSFIPVLDFLFCITPIRLVLEFGMGQGSTPYFLSKGVELHSVEDDPAWMGQWKQKDNLKHKTWLRPLDKMADLFDTDFKALPYDLILVDSKPVSRVNITHKSFQKARIIVLHDTQRKEPSFGCDNIKIDKAYDFVEFTFNPAWTKVLSDDKDILERLRYFNTVITEYRKYYKELQNLTWKPL